MIRLRSTTLSTAIMAVLVLCSGIIYPKNKAKNVNNPQEQITHRLIKMTSINNAPISLVDVKVADRSVKSREKVTDRRKIADWKEWKFEGNSSWVNQLKFTFKNVSDRPIVAISVDLDVSHPSLQAPLNVPLGPNRRVPLFLNKGMSEELKVEKLQPNEEITYSLRPSVIAVIAGQLKRRGATTSIYEVELAVERIQFDDDTSWSSGLIYRRDPTNPSVWHPEKTGAHIKRQGSIIKASYLTSNAEPLSMQFGEQGCFASGEDIQFFCFSNYTIWCQEYDQRVNQNEPGSYYAKFLNIGCRDWEGQICSIQEQWGYRRRLNRNCYV